LFTTAVSIYAIYGSLSRKFKAAMQYPLLVYDLLPEQYSKGAEENAAQLKSVNKLMLGIMLFFCALFIIVGFFFEDGYIMSIIGLALAAFLSLSMVVITSYRVRKLRTGSSLVILSGHGAYTGGEFHCWGTKFTSLDKINLRVSQKSNGLGGYIDIVYTAAALPTRNYAYCSIPVPEAYMQEALQAVNMIRSGA
ncbi:MAG: hypothetical protein PHV32_17450, partial [Eubacteriales bacterium]|nr:hypothetical protein [Eubacteriales bacterium]